MMKSLSFLLFLLPPGLAFVPRHPSLHLDMQQDRLFQPNHHPALPPPSHRRAVTRFLTDGIIPDLAVAQVATSTLLVSHGAATASSTTTVVPLLPVLGSSGIMLTIVGLLFLWEKSVESVRETVPSAILPVVESILAEIGGLGFIGLILQTFGGSLPLEEVSTQLFGEEEILIETFEFLHTAFFQVGVGFFIAAGAMVVVGLQKLGEIETIESLQRDPTTAICTVTTDQLAELLPVLSGDPEQLPKDNLIDEIFMPTKERAGKVLLMRGRLLELYSDLPTTFSIEKYIQGAFAGNLLHLVELSPLTWIYLIPALALANSIDLSHEVINASSPNAAESAGFFFSTPWAIGPSIVTVGLSFVWGIWNCWKLTKIKYMLLPRLGKDTSTGEIIVLPPPIDSASARAQFIPTSSPTWVQFIESLWAKPPRTKYEELFGTAGAAGPKLYRSSIQYQTWLCITNIVFFGTQIVPRDFDALLTGTPVGDPANLIPEVVTYGSFVLLSLIQLIFISPRVFWNFCLVDCSGDNRGVSERLLKQSILPSSES